MRYSKLSIVTSLVASLASTATFAADSIGLVPGSFAATYVPTSAGCSSLLVTGQFLAPTPGYKLSVTKAGTQDNPLVLQLELAAAPPAGQVTQVFTLSPVQYADPNYHDCHYGVAVSYGKQRIVVGLSPAGTQDR
ncbi:hypothetical protein FJ941_02735 [Mesorhizobium sp. B2-3-13]|uniref:hypothetical protein n=1 Tax=Mesorhizobium sp. B2-3-13 TaxID=2589951 RepID=UPI001128B27C|nr:hypothetical protein [Mesorhizobium sp. B2-3-13]TPL89741.1 hypothetical protein FJ941_02735 [Mesorhizobium sp. B2-3-13]